jgi:hypothetical protein
MTVHYAVILIDLEVNKKFKKTNNYSQVWCEYTNLKGKKINEINNYVFRANVYIG